MRRQWLKLITTDGACDVRAVVQCSAAVASQSDTTKVMIVKAGGARLNSAIVFSAGKALRLLCSSRMRPSKQSAKVLVAMAQ